MILSIIIPVFNEKKTIEEIIKRVISAPVFDYEKEIIVVDDNSDDGTREILAKMENKYGFCFLFHDKNLGKGAAIRTALEKVTGDLVITQDADLEYDPKDYQKLLTVFSENFPVIYGSRNLEKAGRGYFLYYLGGRLLTLFLNLLFNSKLTDINTGYKLFKTDVIKSINIESDRFQFCEEVTVKILKKRIQIKEVPINYYPRRFSEGKKIRFKDGFVSIWTIFKYWMK